MQANGGIKQYERKSTEVEQREARVPDVNGANSIEPMGNEQEFYANYTRFVSDEPKRTCSDPTDRGNKVPVKKVYTTVVAEGIEKVMATPTDNRETGHSTSAMNAHIQDMSKVKVREKARKKNMPERSMTKRMSKTYRAKREKVKGTLTVPKALQSRGSNQDARKVCIVVSVDTQEEKKILQNCIKKISEI